MEPGWSAEASSGAARFRARRREREAREARVEEVERQERTRSRRRAEESPPEPRAQARAAKRKRQEAWWRAKSASKAGALEYRTLLYMFISRRVFSHLDPADQIVLRFIFDRSAWFGKDFEFISMHQFVSGSLPRASGEQSFGGTGLSERTVQRSLQRLVEGGLVVREYGAGGAPPRYGLPFLPQLATAPMLAGKNVLFTGSFGATHEVRIGAAGQVSVHAKVGVTMAPPGCHDGAPEDSEG